MKHPFRKPTLHDLARAKHATVHAAHTTKAFIKKRKNFFSFWIVRALIVAITIVIISMGTIFMWIAIQPIPSIQSFEDRKVANSTTIYDSTGQVVLYSVGKNIDRTVVADDYASPLIKKAFVAIEDKTFYTHHGVVIHSTLRGLSFSLLSKFGIPVPKSGGSTITQQVVKNTLLSGEYKLSRKLKEWFLAVKLEKRYTKDQILGLYLNEIPFGGNLYGIEAASKAFFGKSSNNVTLAEAAYLAAIPNAPTYFSPYGKHVDKLEERKNLVLTRMKEMNVITDEELQAAKTEVVTFKPRSDSASKAIHFVEYVRSQLEDMYGADAIESGGFKVYTSLNWKLQEVAEESVKRHALENEKAWNASNQALVAINPKTGEILSMVGSRDYSDPLIDGKFNVALANRQPGSSFKPFIYTLAFEKGYTDQTVLFDVPIQYSTSCPENNFTTTSNGSCYSPDNYDDKYVGPISLRNALGQSRNVPAVQTMYLVGVGDAIRFAKNLGVNSLKGEGQYGLTLVLGGGEVSLLDMTSAYGVFANDGIKVDPVAINKIVDKEGTTIFEHTVNGSQVVSADAARRISSVLSDNVARTPLFGANSLLNFPSTPVAAKTGTTNNNKDAWLIGYTPDVVVGVWSGNNDNTVMKKGSIISAPTWHDVMGKAIGIYGYTAFNAPLPLTQSVKPVLRGKWWGNESVVIDKISKKLATDNTPLETRDEIVVPSPHSILYWVNKNDPQGPAPLNPASDSQYSRWENAVQRWIANHPGLVPAAQPIPTSDDDVHGPEFAPKVTISSATVQNLNGRPTLTVTWSGSDVDLVTYKIIVNGNTLAEYPANTAMATVDLPSDTQGTLDVTVTAVDAVYNTGEDHKQVTL